MIRPPDADDALSSFAHYHVRRCLGRGGMGSVWLAQETWPVQRWVALKVARPEVLSTEVVWRFADERRALGRMDHPHIAKIHEAGTTPDGRLYFAMEFVEGETITGFAERAGLTIEQRLELFVPVCEAVQHAHQRGVIHRDLKPNNILVTARGGQPLPVVIDFGVAMVRCAHGADYDWSAGRDRMLGTPAYMSPEQAADPGASVDGRADVYALGAVLYELLTGSPPLQREALSTESNAELRRLIRQVPPPAPSTRAETADLAQRLHGDLDGIACKALEKDPKRRYDAPRALAEDLVRHLRSEPVSIVRPARGLRRWISRRRER